ncbi:MAG: nucleoside/nucleotide kinase family protein, partial [Lachnospiraceae bacterium]|nr:nucleoside/nucleotide kinase family protein [Lachnospiraceae bacterium]
IFIRAEEEQLRDRLIHRKVMGGKTEAEGRAWYDAVDGPNVRRVLQCSAPADLTLRMVSDGDYRQE